MGKHVQAASIKTLNGQSLIGTGDINVATELAVVSKSFLEDEEYVIQLTTPSQVPMISVMKEVNQNEASINKWNVNSTAVDFDRINYAPANTTLKSTINYVGEATLSLVGETTVLDPILENKLIEVEGGTKVVLLDASTGAGYVMRVSSTSPSLYSGIESGKWTAYDLEFSNNSIQTIGIEEKGLNGNYELINTEIPNPANGSIFEYYPFLADDQTAISYENGDAVIFSTDQSTGIFELAKINSVGDVLWRNQLTGLVQPYYIDYIRVGKNVNGHIIVSYYDSNNLSLKAIGIDINSGTQIYNEIIIASGESIGIKNFSVVSNLEFNYFVYFSVDTGSLKVVISNSQLTEVVKTKDIEVPKYNSSAAISVKALDNTGKFLLSILDVYAGTFSYMILLDESFNVIKTLQVNKDYFVTGKLKFFAQNEEITIFMDGVDSRIVGDGRMSGFIKLDYDLNVLVDFKQVFSFMNSYRFIVLDNGLIFLVLGDYCYWFDKDFNSLNGFPLPTASGSSFTIYKYNNDVKVISSYPSSTANLMFLTIQGDSKIYKDGKSTAVTNISGQIDTTYWNSIASFKVDEEKDENSNLFYALSTDNKQSFKIQRDSLTARRIVRENNGNYEINVKEGITPYSLSNMTNTGKRYTIDSMLGNVRGKINFNADGSILFLQYFTGKSIAAFFLAENFNIETITNYDTSFSFAADIALLGITNVTSFDFSNDGMHLYLVGRTKSTLLQYDLQEAYNLGTAVFTSKAFVYSTTANTLAPSIAFNSNGTKLFFTTVTNNIIISQADLSVPYDLSTAVVSNKVYTDPSGRLIRNLAMTDNYTKLLVTFLLVSASEVHYELFDIGDENDISSLTSLSMFISSSSVYVDNSLNAQICTIVENGTKLIAVDTFYNGSTSFYNIDEYSIAAPYTSEEQWQLSSAEKIEDALSEALTITSNKMDKPILESVSNFQFDNTLDLAIVFDTVENTTIAKYNGIEINYNGSTINKGAILGTDYEIEHPVADKIKVTSKAAQNLKIRVI